MYGYPPGWLEEAKVTDSGLSMFTHHKSEGTKDDEEESAVYDPQLIIDFPGFNTCRGDFIDDSRRFNLPGMHPMHEKQFFISRLKRKSDKRKKIDDVDVIEVDMDESSSRSPTLDDLRNEQKKLLEELNIAQSEKVAVEQKDDDAETDQDTLPEEFVVIDEVLDTSQTSQISNGDCSITTRSNALSVHCGTPILKSCSPYEKLPIGTEIWRAGVSEVIDFENLPNCTGKYEKMKDVLSKVRKQLNK